MPKSGDREFWLNKIRSNIAKHGHHIYVVAGGASPRFAYTIGCNQKFGFELILAGASFYSADDISPIINDIAAKLRTTGAGQELSFEVNSLGAFSLGNVHDSWARNLMLGALDFYNASEIPALQIIPDRAHWTVDVPNLNQQWSAISEPVWQWSDGEEWKYPVSEDSIAVTNLDALRGELVTEATRWEEDVWELFAGAGPDVLKENMRKVPLGTLLAIDKSLNPVVNLDIGKGLWRDTAELKWNFWETASD